MRTTYEIPAKAICPVDGASIDYTITLTVDRPRLAMIPVEHLLEVVATETAQPITQEDLTARLVERLDADVSVLTAGTHSGVKITCAA